MLAPYEIAVIVIYTIALGMLAAYGVHRAHMLWLYFRHRRRAAEAAPPSPPQNAPVVTVQLPLYNEYYVARRLIDAVAALNYPRHALEIQVLDDSTDETQMVAREAVERHRQAGVDIHYLHRDNRAGFKAGALAAGLERARGEFIVIFDADFVPGPDCLKRAIPWFGDSQIGMVQMRWEHLNREWSLLTRIQSIWLDGHLVIEQGARYRSGQFFNFNGTAGVWRRKAIEEAGGWQHDTLTEDLDLSYRAQLAGWRFVYLAGETVPAEIPVDINGLKSQQRRWTKGSVQTARKLIGPVWRSTIPVKRKIESTIHLTNNFPFVLMLLLGIVLWPALRIRMRYQPEWILYLDIPIFCAATLSHAVYCLCSQLEIRRGAWGCLARMPALMALGIGLSINNSKAVFEGLFGKTGEFVRTAKYRVEGIGGDWRRKRYFASFSWVAFAELAMGAYFTAAVVFAWRNGLYNALPFLILFQSGYLYVGFLSLFQRGLPKLGRQDA